MIYLHLVIISLIMMASSSRVSFQKKIVHPIQWTTKCCLQYHHRHYPLEFNCYKLFEINRNNKHKTTYRQSRMFRLITSDTARSKNEYHIFNPTSYQYQTTKSFNNIFRIQRPYSYKYPIGKPTASRYHIRPYSYRYSIGRPNGYQYHTTKSTGNIYKIQRPYSYKYFKSRPTVSKYHIKVYRKKNRFLHMMEFFKSLRRLY